MKFFRSSKLTSPLHPDQHVDGFVPTMLNFPSSRGTNFGSKIIVERSAKPVMKEYKDIYGIPGLSALYDQTGKKIEISQQVFISDNVSKPEIKILLDKKRNRYEPDTIPVPEYYEEEVSPVLFLGTISPHYGHFLTDSMARLWALQCTDPSLPMLTLSRFGVSAFDLPYGEIVFRCNGLASRRQVGVKQPTLFRSVVIPAPAIEYSMKIFDCQQWPHLAVTNTMLPRPRQERFRKVYLSRSSLRDSFRSAGDEYHIEKILSSEGFTIIHPEKIDFADQIEIFNSADWIVGTIGSAFHTALFSSATYHGNIVILSWGQINGRYRLIDAIKNYRPYYINCVTVEERDRKDRILRMSISQAVVADTLSQIGAFRAK